MTGSRAGVERAPILVTGAPRSGTTFLGTMLALDRHTSYIYEPLSANHGLRGIPDPFLLAFHGGRDEALAERLVSGLLAGRGTFHPMRHDVALVSPGRRLVRRLVVSKASLRYRRDRWSPLRRRWLIKDPDAAFSAEWIVRRFGARGVVIVRHPVPTVLSYLRLHWTYPIAQAAALVGPDGRLGEVLGDRFADADLDDLPPLEHGALVWRLYNGVLARYLERNPELTLVRHEDISDDPVPTMRRLYDHIGTPFTDRIEQLVRAHTEAGNQVESTGSQIHVLHRDSSALAHAWRNSVDPEQVRAIREIVEPVSARWYGDPDW